METKQPARRLCSEIQLFDLCDLDYCQKKEGRYCTNKEALERFEAIQEVDDTSEYVAEGLEEEEDEEAAQDDEYEADDYEED